MRPGIAVFAVLLLALCAPLPLPAGASPFWNGLQPGPFEVGFRLIEAEDAARAIRVAAADPEVRPRPLRVYVWYPARPSADRPAMRFQRYATLAGGDVWPEAVPGAAGERVAFSRRPLARSLPPALLQAVLEQPVGAVEDAGAAAGPFPLIVVGQGLYYESPITHALLCELLASHGFVVATTPLVGSQSPLVKLDVRDLETQARDLEFVLASARALPFTSASRLGLLGFDMGGMATLILGMRNPDVDAWVGIETAILYPDLAIPTASPHYDARLLRAPWLLVLRREFAATREQPSLFDTAVHSERSLLLVDGMEHADFTSYALIEGRGPVRGYWGPPRGGEKPRYEAVCLYLSHFFKAHLADDPESRSLLARDPKKVVEGTTMTLEHRPAEPPASVDSDYLNALLAGDVERARDAARHLRQAAPASPLFDEISLLRLAYHLLTSWELAEEATEVFELNAELHPRSLEATESLAEIYLITGNNEKALPVVRRALQIDPESRRALGMLEYLERKLEEGEG